MYVLITDEDLQKAQKESTDAIEIVKFIDEEQIHPIYYSDSYYLVPDGKISIDAFSLFHRAMLETKKAALAKIVMRNREHIFSISPYDGALIAYSLHYPEEVQEIGKIEEVSEVEKISTDINTLSMAKAIIQNLSGEFNLEEYTDEYTQTLMEIIKAKAEGEEIKVEPKVERAKVISLMEALEKSIKETMKTKEEVPRKAMATAGKKAKEPSLKRKKALDV